jgi:hypothetical protein
VLASPIEWPLAQLDGDSGAANWYSGPGG